MKAFQLLAHGIPGRFELRDIPTPHPGPDEALLKVEACGLNHLDLRLEEAGLPVPVALPRTPGCEIAGTIAALGTQVSAGEETFRLRGAPQRRFGATAAESARANLHDSLKPTPHGVGAWRVGDHVAVQSNLFCGECEFCRLGDESLCLNSESLGIQRDGGFAEFCVAPTRALVRLPEKIDFTTSAALTLAGSTAMHMLTDRAAVQAGHWVLVIGGASGVGSAAIQITRELGGQVIATASSPEKRALCQRLGALHVVDSNDPDWPANVRKLTGKRGVDLVVEHVGGAVLQQAFPCLARGGTIVTCGATAGREVTFNLWPFFVKQQRLVGSYGRTRKDMIATLDWAAAGRLRPVIDAVFPLERAAEAFARLRARQVRGKLIIVPSLPNLTWSNLT